MRTSPLRFFLPGLWFSIPVAAALAVVLFVIPTEDDPLSTFARPLLWQAAAQLVEVASELGTSVINTCLLSVAGAHLLGMLLGAVLRARSNKVAAISIDRTRACPSCGTRIQVLATICRHCHTPVKRAYVDENFAGEHMQKLLSMHALGMTDREIAAFLNRNGELLLKDHSMWTARKIAALLTRAKKATGAA